MTCVDCGEALHECTCFRLANPHALALQGAIGAWSDATFPQHHGPDVFEWAVKVYGRSNIYWGDRRDRLYYTAEWCRSQQYIARQMERPRVVAAIGA